MTSNQLLFLIDQKTAEYQVPLCEVDHPNTAFEIHGRLWQFN